MSDVKKGFNVAVGVILALLFAFVILPAGACVGFVVLGAGVGSYSKTVKQAEIENLGPEVEYDNLKFKVIPKGMTISDIAYTFTVKNRRDYSVKKNFDVTFFDAEGFPVAEDVILFENLPPNAHQDLSGTRLVKNELASAVVRMVVTEK